MAGRRMGRGRGRALLAAVAMAVGLALAPVPARADGVTVSSFDELQKAVTEATGDRTITVGADIAFEGTVEVPEGANVTITDGDAEHTLSWAEGVRGSSFIEVPQGASLTLDVNMDAANLNVSAGVSGRGNFVTVNGALTIEGGTYQNATCASFEAGCFLVDGDGAAMTINGGTITGNTFTNQQGGIITVQHNGDLTMNGGLITENYEDEGQVNNATVYLRGYDGNATFTMNGGEISNNTGYMGAVFVGERYQPDYTSTATFTMTGGTISGNKAGYCGGGVAVWTSGSFYFQGGEISGNTAPIGAGVSASDLYKAAVESTGNSGSISIDDWGNKYNCPARFEMTGGTITGNHAIYNYLEFLDTDNGGCGGGVYVASNTCSIFGGTISDNIAERQGGGVYVGATPYTLHMKDVLVTNNTASILGGGMWLCPTGSAHTSVTNGGLIAGNTAAADDGSTAGDDVASVPQDGKVGRVTLSDRALGGGPNAWYDDGAVTESSPDGEQSVLGYADPSVSRYDGSGEQRTDIEGVDTQLALKNVASEDTTELAEGAAKVLITGNSAPRGGGIGTNGSISIGPNRYPDEEEQTWKLVVTKQWDEGVPEQMRHSVSVNLTIGDHTLDAVELNAENNWTASFDELPDPDSLGDMSVGVVEQGHSYKVSYGDVQRDDATRTMTVTVTNAMLDPVTVQPAEMTIYMGGTDGYESVVSGQQSADDVVTSATNSLPEPGFYVYLPDDANQALEDAGIRAEGEAADLSQYITVHTADNSKTWTLERYGDTHSGAYDRFVYRIVAAEGQDPVRLEFTGEDGTTYTSDTFDPQAVGALNRSYGMSIYPGDVDLNNIYLDLKVGDETRTYVVQVQPSTLNVRYVTGSQDDVVTGSLTDIADAPRPGERAYAVHPEGTKFFINDSEIDVTDAAAPSLLFDDVVSSDNTAGAEDYRSQLEDRAFTTLGDAVADYQHPSFQSRYLDLVDANNGNVWLKASNPTTVYWPYPEGTDSSTEFHLVHFKGLNREMANGDVAGNIDAAETEVIEVENTEYGIRFTTDGFSPFVLVWDGGDETQGDGTPGQPGGPAATTPDDTTPAGTVLPKTSDPTSAVPVVVLAGAGCAAIAGAAAARRRRRDA